MKVINRSRGPLCRPAILPSPPNQLLGTQTTRPVMTSGGPLHLFLI